MTGAGVHTTVADPALPEIDRGPCQTTEELGSLATRARFRETDKAVDGDVDGICRQLAWMQTDDFRMRRRRCPFARREELLFQLLARAGTNDFDLDITPHNVSRQLDHSGGEVD